MKIKNFEEIDAKEIPFGKFIGIIGKSSAYYLNHKLSRYQINSSQVNILFEIKRNNGLNQELISKYCNMNKGAVARSLKNLEDKGFITRKTDENNRRQNIISLTNEGEKITEKTQKTFENWEKEILNELDDETIDYLKIILKKISIQSIEINKELKKEKNNK